MSHLQKSLLGSSPQECGATHQAEGSPQAQMIAQPDDFRDFDRALIAVVVLSSIVALLLSVMLSAP